MEDSLALLSLIIFLPAAVAALLVFVPGKQEEIIRYITLTATVITLILTVGLLLDPTGTGLSPIRFNTAQAEMQSTFNVAWIPSFDINYFMGIDGISLPLVVLTALVSVLAMGASWSIKKHVKAYCILFLLLETGMIGVFLALDFFLFYVFWEVMLLPMYFLIGVWGGPRREYAAIKFFLYTLAGSVLMLIAILMLYFNSDLRAVAKASDLYGDKEAAVVWDNLKVDGDPSDKNSITSRLKRENMLSSFEESRPDSGLKLSSAGPGAGKLRLFFESGSETAVDYNDKSGIATITLGKGNTEKTIAEAINSHKELSSVVKAEVEGEGDAPVAADEPIHTFNLLALAAIGQHTSCFSRDLQWWAFVLLFIGFAIKVPAVPVHTWLPDAHVEAPTPISMILAGVLLKMGGYGIVRICYPICPFGAYDLAFVVCLIGVVSMIYGAFAALAQTDFKRMVAYSSVSHMGYVVLGLGVWSALAGNNFNPYYWNMGVKGAMFQMIGHGISSAGMFFMVGVIYDRVHHRNLNEFGGLFGKMPVYSALAIGIFFAGLGLPGLCGFIGEVLVVLSVWKYSYILAILSAFVVILTAGYILWALQRVYLGSEYKGPHADELKPINFRELAIAVPLFVLAIIMGVMPHQTVLRYMDATVDRQVEDLAGWTRRVAAPIEYEESQEKEGGEETARKVDDADDAEVFKAAAK